MTEYSWQCVTCSTSAVVGSMATAKVRAEQHARIKHGGNLTHVTYGKTSW